MDIYENKTDGEIWDRAADRTRGVITAGGTKEYTLSGCLGSSFLFEQGRYDGFRPEDVTLFLTDSVCAPVVDSQCTNVTRLMRDFRLGRFAAAVPPRQRAR